MPARGRPDARTQPAPRIREAGVTVTYQSDRSDWRCIRYELLP